MRNRKPRLAPSIPDNALLSNLKGVYSLPPPPEGFNALAASNEILKLYGLPPRPDPRRNPHALRSWTRAFSRPLGRFVAPVFTPAPQVIRKRPRGGITDPVVVNADSNWSGCVLSGAGNWESVWGRWTVPDVTIPASAGSQHDFSCSTWVGIDSSPANDLLQAGTHQEILGSLAGPGLVQLVLVNYYAWVEWYVNEPSAPPEQTISSIPVHAGDVIDVLVNYVPGYNQGYVQFNNLTQGKYTSFYVPAPANASFQGNSIEWILEQPLTLPPGATTPVNLPIPDFGTVIFSNAGGCSSDKVSGNPDDGGTVSIVNGGNTLTSETTGNGFVTCTYE